MKTCYHCGADAPYPTRPISNATHVCTREQARSYQSEYLTRKQIDSEFEKLQALWREIDAPKETE